MDLKHGLLIRTRPGVVPVTRNCCSTSQSAHLCDTVSTSYLSRRKTDTKSWRSCISFPHRLVWNKLNFLSMSCSGTAMHVLRAFQIPAGKLYMNRSTLENLCVPRSRTTMSFMLRCRESDLGLYQHSLLRGRLLDQGKRRRRSKLCSDDHSMPDVERQQKFPHYPTYAYPPSQLSSVCTRLPHPRYQALQLPSHRVQGLDRKARQKDAREANDPA